jgi:hypothetical protein
MTIRGCNSRVFRQYDQRLMGLISNNIRYIIWLVMFAAFSLSSFVRGSNDYSIESLNAFIHDLADKALVKPRTGTLYNISLPANFSGMEVSVVRIRSGKFWDKGANFSFFHIPPGIRPIPSAKRLSILYQNLGNWSSYYYNVPGYRLVAPVVGLTAYDSSNSSTIGNRRVDFSIMGDPISVHFLNIVIQDHVTPKCVEFGADGSFQLQDMNESYVCITHGEGHFSVVVLKKQEEGNMKLWALGFGFVGLVSVVLVMVAIARLLRRKKMRKMEKQSERGVAFDTFWIGGSKMPSASMVRTQPALENRYVP